MADDKRGREKQARDEENRDRKRATAEALERGDEPEPPLEPAELTDLERKLDDVAFPATGAEIVDAAGDTEIQAGEGTFTIAELVPATEAETYDAPDAVRVQVERPTVAAAMKRVVEAVHTVPNSKFRHSQRDAYVKTFEELAAIDADDDDEGITAIADWIVDRIDEKGTVPGSRDVRRQAAKFCRANDYQVRNDEWLGV